MALGSTVVFSLTKYDGAKNLQSKANFLSFVLRGVKSASLK